MLASVQADPQAVAWMRVTAANPCAWCAMLASRACLQDGAVRWLPRAQPCRCSAAPVWSKEDAEALRNNDLYEQWKRVTRGYHKKDALNAWRRYWDKQLNRDGIGCYLPLS